jgi:hypothetical protein
MPEELDNTEEQAGKQPVAQKHEDEGPLPRVKAENFDARIATRRRTAFGMLFLLDRPLHVSLVPVEASKPSCRTRCQKTHSLVALARHRTCLGKSQDARVDSVEQNRYKG